MTQEINQTVPDGSYEVKYSNSFVYRALWKEPYVGNVCLRAYNDQPDFKISEPEAFCIAFLGFISFLIHNQDAAVSDDQDILNLNGSPFNTPEVQTDTIDKSVFVRNISDDSLVVSDGKVTTDENSELVKNLQFGLTSFQNLLTSSSNLASISSTKEQLLPLYGCFSVSVASESNILQLCF